MKLEPTARNAVNPSDTFRELMAPRAGVAMVLDIGAGFQSSPEIDRLRQCLSEATICTPTIDGRVARGMSSPSMIVIDSVMGEDSIPLSKAEYEISEDGKSVMLNTCPDEISLRITASAMSTEEDRKDRLLNRKARRRKKALTRRMEKHQ